MLEGVGVASVAVPLHGGPSARWGLVTYLLAPLLGGIHGFTAAALTLPLRSWRRPDGGGGERAYLLRGTALGVVNLVFVVLAWELLPHAARDAARSLGATVPWILAQAVALAPLWATVVGWSRVDGGRFAPVAATLRVTPQYFGGLLALVAVAAVASL